MSKQINYFSGERYNQLAKKEGYRSRAAFKLIQINKKFNLIKSGQNILDIGATPGSWSQAAKKIIKNNGTITAIDILPMEKIDGVQFIHKDLLEVDEREFQFKFNLVISDIAPNISGIGILDDEKMIELLNIEIYLIEKVLEKGGSFLAKCFQGESYVHLKKGLKERFKEIHRFKPDASRKTSNECYLIGISKKG